MALIESSGAFHPASLGDVPDWLLPAGMDTTFLAGRIDELEAVIGFLREHSPKPGFPERFGAVPRSIPVERLVALLDDGDLLWRATRAWRIAMLMSERQGDLNETNEETAFLSKWVDLPFPFGSLGRHGSFTVTAGTCPQGAILSLIALSEREPLLSVEEIGSPAGRDETSKVLVILHEEAGEELRQEVARLGFAHVDFGDRRGTPREMLGHALLRSRALGHRLEKLRSEAETLAVDLPLFEDLRDAAGLLLEKTSASSTGLVGDRLFLLHGWVREHDMERLQADISALGLAFVERIEPLEGEVPPSALSETPLMDPYVMLTDMFGSPAPSDPDPTPLMAPFYALFLGICIGDAGYGLLLTLISALGLLSARRKGRRNRLFGVLFQGGLATILVGVFLGAFFGIDRAVLPSWMTSPAGLLDSLVPGGGQFGLSKQFLYVAMALGVVQLLTGIVINFLKRWRAGERATAILEQSGWLLSSFGLFPWLFNHYLLNGGLYDIEGPLDGILLKSLLAGAVLIFVMGGREAKGFGKVGLGAMAAYGIVNILADALSYSRLFALSLSGGIIATVVNQISGMLPGTDIPGVGLLVSIPVLVIGHAFNLSMGILGGFIHTARLQFVEFFGKFYEGTGAPFVPLRYKPQYINIIRKNPEGSNR